jgi:2-phosphosulfolactate phosphatase
MVAGGQNLAERILHVHLLPDVVPAGRLAGGIAVVVDVLRATTTIVHALAAGCTCVRPLATAEEARQLADGMRAGKVILAGERGGLKIDGFDRGNSPAEFASANCQDCTLVMTTTNGTRAMLRAAEADRVLIAAFANFSAVCEQLLADPRPLHILCAGTDGEPSLEDALLAGAFIERLCDHFELQLNDSARLAWDCFENQGLVLPSALELGKGGQTLLRLGFEADIAAAAEVDLFTIVPELKRDPVRIEIGSAGVVRSHWPR